MARTINEIRRQIAEKFISDPVIITSYGLTPGQSFDDQFSAVSMENIIFSAVATYHWIIENLFDYHKLEVQEIMADWEVGKLRWWRKKALDFQYGFPLVEDQDYYDNTGIDESVVAASKIVKYAAVTKDKRGIRIKIAKENGGDLEPLSETEFAAFSAYMYEVGTGINIILVNRVADSLQASMRIFYNPLVLNANGERLDGTNNTPVQDALDTYLKQLTFGGLFVEASMMDALQKVDGVVIPHIDSLWAQYGAFPWADIDVTYLPDAGYIRIKDPEDLNITFLPHEPI